MPTSSLFMPPISKSQILIVWSHEAVHTFVRSHRSRKSSHTSGRKFKNYCFTSPSASVNATPEIPSLCPASVITGVLVSVDEVFFALFEPSELPSAELSSLPDP